MAQGSMNVFVNLTLDDEAGEVIRRIVRDEVAAIALDAYWDTERPGVERAMETLRNAALERNRRADAANREESTTR